MHFSSLTKTPHTTAQQNATASRKTQPSFEENQIRQSRCFSAAVIYISSVPSSTAKYEEHNTTEQCGCSRYEYGCGCRVEVKLDDRI